MCVVDDDEMLYETVVLTWVVDGDGLLVFGCVVCVVDDDWVGVVVDDDWSGVDVEDPIEMLCIAEDDDDDDNDV